MKTTSKKPQSNSQTTSTDLLTKFRALPQKVKFWLTGGTGLVAVAITATLFGSTLSAPPLIQLSDSPSGPQDSSSMVSEGSEDKMMMPYATYEYVAGSELSRDGGTGQVYKLVRTGSPEAVLTNVAEVFGVQGTVKKYPDYNDENPGYFLSNSEDPWGVDGENPMVSIWWSGTGSWNYSNAGDATISSSSCAEESPDGICQEWTEVLPTPELLPSREEAIAKALEIFNATGLSVSESDLNIDYSEWGVYISAGLKVDGQPTSIEWYVGWSSSGELSYAGGHSVIAESVGTYDTISPVQAVDRLKDWRWYGSAASSYYDKYFDSTSSSNARTDQLVEPGSPEGQESSEPEIVKLTITSAEAALLTIWDSSGVVWLVPGLIMVNDSGWFDAVISLVDGVIALPEPSTVDIEPLPADDSPVSDK